MSNGNGYTLVAVARKENSNEIKKIELLMPYEEKTNTYLSNIDQFTTMFSGSRGLINFYKNVFKKNNIDIDKDSIRLKIVGNLDKTKEISVSYQVHNVLQDFAVYNEATIKESSTQYLLLILKKEMLKGNFIGTLNESHTIPKMLDFRIEELKRGITTHELYIKQELSYYKNARKLIHGIIHYEQKYDTTILQRSEKYDQLSDLTFEEKNVYGVSR